MLEALKNAYAMFEQLNISVTSLIVIAVILALAFLFSVREAATWFFKVDDLKRDIARLSDTAKQMDSQIKTLQTLMTDLKKSNAAEVTATHAANAAPALPLKSETVVVASPTTAPATAAASQTAAKPAPRFGQPLNIATKAPSSEDSGSFPIVH